MKGWQFTWRKMLYVIVAVLLLIGVLIAVSKIYEPTEAERSIQKHTIDSLLKWHPKEFESLEEKFEYIAGAKSLAIEFGCAELIGDVYFKEASLYKSNYQFSKAIASLETAEKYYDRDNCDEKQSKVLLRLAFTYMHWGEFDKALDLCNRGIKIFKKGKNNTIGCKFYNQKGHVYNILNDKENTKILYEQALELSYKTNDGRLISRCINDLGNFYGSIGNDSLALMLYNKSICASNDSASLLRYYNNIGDIYLKRNESQKAYEYLKKAQNFENPKDKEFILYWTMGEYFYSINQYDSTIVYFKKVLDNAKIMHFKHYLHDIHKQLSDVYLKVGNTMSAYQELEECIKIKNELFSLQKGIAVSKVENELQKVKREQKIEQYHLVAIIVSLVLILILFAIYLRIKYFKSILTTTKKRNENLLLENCSIKSDLNSKEEELVTVSLKLAQNEESKVQIADKIDKIRNVANADTIKYLNDVLNNLKNESFNENMWNEFEIHFNQANNQFYKNLVVKHPKLSRTEKKLCAFLRLNLSTKEISLLTGQTPNSIFVARTRLRKKLNLSNSSVDIAEYLQGL